MPPVPVSPVAVIEAQASAAASNLLHAGYEALPAIGTALLGISALFVIFFYVLRSFGWRVHFPKRPPRPKGIIGNPNKIHFRRDLSKVGPKFNPNAGPWTVTADATAWNYVGADDDDYGNFYDDIDRNNVLIDVVAAQPEYYTDLGLYPYFASDLGPSDTPGYQEGIYPFSFPVGNHSVRERLFSGEPVEWDDFMASDAVGEHWVSSRDLLRNLEANYEAAFGRSISLPSDPEHPEAASLALHTAHLIEAKHRQFLDDVSSDSLADFDIDYDPGAYDR